MAEGSDSQQPIIIRRKKGGGHGGHHGGSWKVAFADFMTAMMAFFLVMWLVGQSDRVKEAVAGYFRDPRLQLAFTFQSKSSTCAYATEIFFGLLRDLRAAPPTDEELRVLRDLHERTRRAHSRPVPLPV